LAYPLSEKLIVFVLAFLGSIFTEIIGKGALLYAIPGNWKPFEQAGILAIRRSSHARTESIKSSWRHG
jgi:hypothetical protein